MKKTKCYIYTRVSTAMQVDGYSLDAQKDKLKRYADYEEIHGLTVSKRRIIIAILKVSHLTTTLNKRHFYSEGKYGGYYYARLR